jgi:hypothetical protein
MARRGFLGTGLKAAAAFTAASYSRIYGANERINMGLIGAGERGRGVMGSFLQSGQADLVAVCDVYAQMIDRAKQRSPQAKAFKDHRELLQMKEVDAVLIGTPDHWHAATAIDAMNAGKDVYVERPRASTTASARSASSSVPVCTTSRPSRSTLTPKPSARSRSSAHGGTATPIICARLRRHSPPSPQTSTGPASSAP